MSIVGTSISNVASAIATLFANANNTISHATCFAHRRSRLDAIGRIWVLDAVLGFRDRFTSRLNYAQYDEAVVTAEGDGKGEKLFLTGNCDNVLFTPFKLGFAAIDSHCKLIRGDGDSAAKKVADEQFSSSAERLQGELEGLLGGDGIRR